MGVAWPPPKGHEHKHGKFMSMVKEPALHSNDAGGIMVGYTGHVPRARDKVGQNPMGKLINGRSSDGFPTPESTSPEKLRAFGTQSTKPSEPDEYVSVLHKTQFDTATSMATGSGSPTKLATLNAGDTYIPRYSGHIPQSKHQVGGSVYGGGKP